MPGRGSAVGRCVPSSPAALTVSVPAARRRVAAQASPAPAASASTADLPPELAKIVTAFQMVPDPKVKYAQLLAYGQKLAPLPAADHTDAHKVRGCVSQVWVVPDLRADGTLHWSADSDSALTKGLAALLVLGLSGSPPDAVARLAPDWITSLGLAQSLTPSRNNGFLNMFKLMQTQAIAAAAAVESGVGGGGGGGGGAPPAASPSAPTAKPVRAAIEAKLSAALAPLASLTVIDESGQHAGHAGAKGVASPSGETHFRVAAVSPAFAGLPLVKRHRLIYEALADELAGPLHALALETLTPEEAAAKGGA